MWTHCQDEIWSVLATVGEVREEDKLFSSLSDVVSEKTLSAIGDVGFTHMMEIQYRSIRPLLQGK